MEIEKKFRIKYLPENLEQYTYFEIEQGYLSTRPVVRIRKKNEDYILTYKSKGSLKEKEYDTRISNEVELPLTKESYLHLREKIDGNLIKKKRYLIPWEKNLKVELDIFEGCLEGLVFAEVEFSSIEEAVEFVPPEWFAEDVTMDKRYKNSYLSTCDQVPL